MFNWSFNPAISRHQLSRCRHLLISTDFMPHLSQRLRMRTSQNENRRYKQCWRQQVWHSGNHTVDNPVCTREAKNTTLPNRIQLFLKLYPKCLLKAF